MLTKRGFLATTILATSYVGYGRSAYAGDCTATGGGSYLCSGAATGGDTTQTITSEPLNITTSADFGITTATGAALDLTGEAGVAFTQTGTGAISGATYGIDVTADRPHHPRVPVDVVITVSGDVSGADAGIRVDFYSDEGYRYSGSAESHIIINSSGTVSSSGGDAIHVYNDTDRVYYRELVTASTSISVNNAYGFNNGIYTRSEAASGATSVIATGQVTGSTGDGILAITEGHPANGYRDDKRATTMTIQAVDVTGGRNGIFATHSGSGTLSITTTGTVQGLTGDGIIVDGSADSDDSGGVDVNVASVYGGVNGISAYNVGDNDMRISASGTIVGSAGDGINAVVGADAPAYTGYGYISPHSLAINVVNVYGAQDGIDARADGAALSIATSGTVVGTAGAGIRAETRVRGDIYYGTPLPDPNAAGALTIDASNVYGVTHGIHAVHGGYDNLTITTTGNVTATTGTGIAAEHNSDGDLLLSVVDVSGTQGIVTSGSSAGSAFIDVFRTVNGGIQNDLVSEGGANINIGSGAVVQATGVAIGDGASDSVVYIEGTVSSGAIDLGAGDDQLELFGLNVDIVGISGLDGGAGMDSVLLDNFVGDLSAPLGLATNFETLSLVNDTEVLVQSTMMEFDQLILDDSSALYVNGPSGVTGSLSNSYGISMWDVSTDDSFNIGGDYTSVDGAFALDINLTEGSADHVIIEGDVTGETVIVLNVQDAVLPDPDVVALQDILLVDVGGEAAEGAFYLSRGPISLGVYTYDLIQTAGNDFIFGLGMGEGAMTASSLLQSIGLSQAALGQLTQSLPQNVVGWYNTTQETPAMAFSPVAEPSSRGWVRYLGAWSDGTRTAQIGAVSSELEDTARLQGLQVGADFRLNNGLELSFAAHSLDERHNISMVGGGATSRIETQNVGATIGARYDFANMFVDGKLSYSRLDLDMSNSAFDTGATQGTTSQFSLAFGKEFALGSGDLNLTPSIRYSYFQTDLDDFTDTGGNAYTDLSSKHHSLAVGADIARVVDGRQGQFEFRGGLHVAHAFGRDESTVFETLDVSSTTASNTTAVVSMGVEYNAFKGLDLRAWGDVSHQISLSGDTAPITSASLGLALHF